MLRAFPNDIRRWSVQTLCHRGLNIQRAIQTSSDASASAQAQTNNPFPYPKHRNPTPHQLFHLPHNATESDIKARYFDLVRLYHPDKVGASTSSDLAHARFRAITAAYDSLRGKTSLTGDSMGHGSSASSALRYQTTAAYRTMQKKRQELYDSGPVDDSRKDTLIVFGVVITVIMVMVQLSTMRGEVLSESLARHRQASQSMRSSLSEEQRLSQDFSNKPSD